MLDEAKSSLHTYVAQTMGMCSIPTSPIMQKLRQNAFLFTTAEYKAPDLNSALQKYLIAPSPPQNLSLPSTNGNYSHYCAHYIALVHYPILHGNSGDIPLTNNSAG